MKKVLSIILMIGMLCMGIAHAQVPGNQLGFDALKLLADGTENQVFSPISLAYALAMAAEGADGATERELEKALGTDDVDDWAEFLTRTLQNAGLKLANAAFVTSELRPEEDYVEELRDSFDAEWFEMDGDMVTKINDWTYAHTDGLIEKLLNGPLDLQTQLVLLNAVAMDAEWQVKFDPENNFEGIFYAPEEEANVEFMRKVLYADYAEMEGVQLLRLNYRDSDLTMLIALPEVGGISTVLEALSEQGLDYFQFGEEQVRVELTMPKLDIAAENSLKEVLQTLGVEQAFSDAADFSDISEEVPLMIGQVLQKARLIVDEDGTKAAAATEIAMLTSALLIVEEPVAFNINRPFVALIAEEDSGTVCFASVIANPATGEREG